MNIQLYMVDSINFLVDFHHTKSYRASQQPGAGRFDRAASNPSDKDGNTAPSTGPEVVVNGQVTSEPEDEACVSPFVFMDCACRLILELAGGGG